MPGIPGRAHDLVDLAATACETPRERVLARRRRPTTRTRVAHDLRGAGQHDGLIARRADTDEAHGHAGELLDELHVVARRGRKIFERAAVSISVPQPGSVSYTGRTLCSTDWWYGTWS